MSVSVYVAAWTTSAIQVLQFNQVPHTQQNQKRLVFKFLIEQPKAELEWISSNYYQKFYYLSSSTLKKGERTTRVYKPQQRQSKARSWGWLMLLSPSSAEKVSKIRVKSQKPLPSYRMDRNDDELDAMMVSVVVCHF